ncbi:recombinase RecT [Streptococcus suis]
MTTNQLMTQHNNFFKSEAVQHRLQEVVGKKSNQFATTMLSILRDNDMLSKADSSSILTAALKAVSLSLPIEPSLGFAYVVPFNNRKKRIIEAQFQLGYKGLIQLAMRSGQITKLNAGPIYEGQFKSFDEVTEELDYIKGYEKNENEGIAGYFAYFRLSNGFEKRIFWTLEQIKEHAKRYSQSYKSGYGPWIDNFDAMARKTVLKSILSTYAPLSTEMQEAISADNDELNFNQSDEIKVAEPVNTDQQLLDDLMNVDTETGEILEEVSELKDNGELDLKYEDPNAR